MNSNKIDLQISVKEKDIEIKGKTFVFQVNFDDLSFLSMDHEQKVYAEEMEMELAIVEKYHPELKDKVRIALHTPQFSCVFTAHRRESDKIARLDHERFKEIMLNGTPCNFFEEHEKLVGELQSEDGTEEVSYPVYFHSCGHHFADQESLTAKEDSGSERLR